MDWMMIWTCIKADEVIHFNGNGRLRRCRLCADLICTTCNYFVSMSVGISFILSTEPCNSEVPASLSSHHTSNKQSHHTHTPSSSIHPTPIHCNTGWQFSLYFYPPLSPTYSLTPHCFLVAAYTGVWCLSHSCNNSAEGCCHWLICLWVNSFSIQNRSYCKESCHRFCE